MLVGEVFEGVGTVGICEAILDGDGGGWGCGVHGVGVVRTTEEEGEVGGGVEGDYCVLGVVGERGEGSERECIGDGCFMGRARSGCVRSGWWL